MRQGLVFSIIVCVFALTMPTFAATSGDYEYTNNGDGTCTITAYTGPGGDVTIPDTLNGLAVTSIGTRAFYYCRSMTSLTIPDSVTSLGDWSFTGCSGLTSVTIGNGVASLGFSAFQFLQQPDERDDPR